MSFAELEPNNGTPLIFPTKLADVASSMIIYMILLMTLQIIDMRNQHRKVYAVRANRTEARALKWPAATGNRLKDPVTQMIFHAL